MSVLLTEFPWRQNPRPALGLVTDWYINDATGNDAFNGQSATADGNGGGPFKTMERLNDVLWPNGAYLLIKQDVTVHLAAGAGQTPVTYSAPRPRVRNTAGAGFFLSFIGEFSEGATITGTTFTNTNPAGSTRGEVVAAGATFVRGDRLRSTSGANEGSIAFVTGIASATDAFLTGWTDTGGNFVNLTNGDTLVQDTLLVTIKSLDGVYNNYSDGGGLFMQDVILGDSGGGTFNATSDSLRDGVTWYRSKWFGDGTSWSVGNSLVVASELHGNTSLGAGFWRFGGSVYFSQGSAGVNTLALFDHGANVQFEGPNCSDGVRIFFARGSFCEFIRSGDAKESLEFENGTGVSAALQFGQGTWWYASNYPFWGVTGNFTVGLVCTGPVFGSFGQNPPVLSIPSATNASLNGQSFTWATLPQRIGSVIIDNTAAALLDATTIHLTAQTAAKGATNIFSANPPAGLYLVSVMVEVTTAGTAGTITGNVLATGDGAGAKTQSTAASALITGLSMTSGSFLVRCNGSTQIQYSTTFTGVTAGALAYAINVTAKRVGN